MTLIMFNVYAINSIWKEHLTFQHEEVLIQMLNVWDVKM